MVEQWMQLSTVACDFEWSTGRHVSPKSCGRLCKVEPTATHVYWQVHFTDGLCCELGCLCVLCESGDPQQLLLL